MFTVEANCSSGHSCDELPDREGAPHEDEVAQVETRFRSSLLGSHL
jgi:hypothetical protein